MVYQQSNKQGDLNSTLMERIALLETVVTRIGVLLKGSKKHSFSPKRQSQMFAHMTKALCVETVDPWKENRVRFYHPLVHHPKTPILALPFARPISPFGGFDDSGVNWVPPAGSTLCIVFENADRDAPHYLGTTWQRDRGPSGSNLGFPSREWDRVYRGHRKGYLIGKNDESQCFPPWNTESSNGRDIDDISDFIDDPQEQIRTTYPNIYGFKTPEKHMLKMVDGNAKCNRRWKRLELMSGCGNWLIFKDDHLHYGGQWAHPTCRPEPGGAPVDVCSTHKGELPYFTDMHGKPIEKGAGCEPGCDCNHEASGSEDVYCEPSSCARIMTGHPSTPNFPPSQGGRPVTPYHLTNKGTNPFFKHANECRPYRGPGTPQNNRCDLPQSGIQLLSISGHTFVMDDSVKEPRGKPEWERSTKPFDFGCDNTYMGVYYMKSATGHSIAMCDVEKAPGLRGEHNYIELKTATGNRIHLNDHTEHPRTESGGSTEGINCPKAPPAHAGQYRGIFMESTSGHIFNMNDWMNEQVGPCRAEGGLPENKASKAYVIVQSGYGHKMHFVDYPENQRSTQKQYIHIENPQCSSSGPKEDRTCNTEKGPHFLRFQASPKPDPGLVFLRVGGHSLRTTTDMDVVLVGTKENPSNKFTWVSKNFTTATEEVHFRYAGDRHILFAENKIVLLAGRDCPPPEDSRCPGPCLYSVIISRCPVRCPVTWMLHWTERAMSERVFASGYHPCQVPCGGDCESYWAAMARADASTCNEVGEAQDLGMGVPIQIQRPPDATNVDPGDWETIGGGVSV